MTTSRERILDAYADVLTDEGECHATLEAVAARAGVSKGGLLYHFPSKDQLAEALCDRLVALGATRVQRFEAEPYVGDGFIVMQDPEGNEFRLD